MAQFDKRKEAAATAASWRTTAGTPSLPEVHRSIEIPATFSFWRKLLAFAGPGYLVAVGYMDPGNWATDLAAGAQFNYTLLSVIMLSNLMAILLQSLAIRLGIVMGKETGSQKNGMLAKLLVYFINAMIESFHFHCFQGRIK